MMNREKHITRVTVWGAVGNVVLTAFKFVAGIVGHSSAMVADAIHSLTDLVSDVVVLIMVKISSRGVDRNHGYGHGKFETMATVVVALLLLVVGGELLVEGIGKIRVVVQGGELPVPGTIALWAALVSIAVKEGLYQWTARVGKKVNSPAMITNAWHHRSDALSSIGAALGIGCAVAFGGKWAVLDPIVCCAISLFIIVISVKMAVPALHELTDGALPEVVEKEIADLITSIPGVEGVHDLRTRRSGHIMIIGAHIVVEPSMSVSEAHHLTVLAENAVRERFGGETQISLHIEPAEDAE